MLCSQVAPVHSRGEHLLSVLQATPRKRRVCGRSCAGDASISCSDYEDVNSSADDTARQVCGRHCEFFRLRLITCCDACGVFQIFHRRVSRVPGPQTDQTFSIAAALPRPCYVSFTRSDETLTFSQTQHTAQHTAQQLTLLEQVNTIIP